MEGACTTSQDISQDISSLLLTLVRANYWIITSTNVRAVYNLTIILAMPKVPLLHVVCSVGVNF